MDYTDINGKPINIKKKAANHVKSIKNSKQEMKIKLKPMESNFKAKQL